MEDDVGRNVWSLYDDDSGGDADDEGEAGEEAPENRGRGCGDAFCEHD